MVEVLATLAVAAVIFSVITLAMHTLRSKVDTTNEDAGADRHIAKATSILDRMFTNATEVLAISEGQINLRVYEKDASGTTAIVFKALYYQNGSLYACPVASMTEALTALCASPAAITDRLLGPPVYTSTVFASDGTRTSVTLSASGAPGTTDTIRDGQLMDISLPFVFRTGIGEQVKNKVVSLHYKLWDN